MQPHENVHRGIKKIIIHNFLGGIAWGLGATVGLAIVLALLGFILNKIDVIPVIGDFVAQIESYINTKKPSPTFR